MLHLSWKVDGEITNRLTDEIRKKYGVTIDATTDQVVDNLQIRVSCFRTCASKRFKGLFTCVAYVTI